MTVNHVEIVRLLVTEGGADVEATHVNGMTALHIAVIRQHIEVVRLLIASGVDVNAKDSKGWTPLHWARSVEIARLLVESGANIEAKDDGGCVPLDWAGHEKNMPVVIYKHDIVRRSRYAPDGLK